MDFPTARADSTTGTHEHTRLLPSSVEESRQGISTTKEMSSCRDTTTSAPPWQLGASDTDEKSERSLLDRACRTDDECGAFEPDSPPLFAGKFTAYLWISAVAIALNALSLGYDVGCMNDALGLITAQYQLDYYQGEIIDGCLNFFAAIGALFAARLADGPLGRRGCLACSAGSYLAGICVSTLAVNWVMVAAGRALCGIAVGLSFSSGGLYLTEISPAHLRGTLGSLYDLGIDMGIVLGSLVGYMAMVTDTALFGSRWRFMVGFGAAMPALVLIAAPFLPESPRWLLANGRPREARETLQRLYGDTGSSVKNAMREFQQCCSGEPASWKDFFNEMVTNAGGMRRTLLLVMTLGILQQATGSESILYYCHIFLRESGTKSTAALSLGFVFVGLSKLAGNIPPLLFADAYGRLPFLRFSSVGVAGALFSLVIVCNAGTYGIAEVVLMCVFLFFFSFGLGTLLWVIIPEMLPFQWRARGLAGVVVLNRFTSATVTMTALSIIKLVHVSGFFTLYLGFAIVCLMLTFMILPETAGKSLESLTRTTSHEALSWGLI